MAVNFIIVLRFQTKKKTWNRYCFVSNSSRQCPAVMIHCAPTIVAPQMNLPSRCNATMNGHASGPDSEPPTIRISVLSSPSQSVSTSSDFFAPGFRTSVEVAVVGEEMVEDRSDIVIPFGSGGRTPQLGKPQLTWTMTCQLKFNLVYW